MDNLDITIMAAQNGSPLDSDNEAIAAMQTAVRDFRASEHEGNRLRVHLVLRNQILADSLKKMPLSNNMAENVELYAYTLEDLRAMELLGICPESPTKLDRQPVTSDCESFIHLVIFGLSGQAESLALHAALTAHYPNYCRDNTLRTRITMIADDLDQFHNFQQRFDNLLLNSYRRTVVVRGSEVECEEYAPQYAGTRRDFVDVEWEFVAGSSNDTVMNYKLKKWAQDDGQQLTVVFCYNDDNRNVNDALTLPAELLDTTPVWLQVRNDCALTFLSQSEQYRHIVPFGMSDAKLPDMPLFIRLAQCVNFAYNQMREKARKETSTDNCFMDVAVDPPTERELQEIWNNSKLNTQKRWSNIYNAFTLRSKMHSLGHADEEWGTLFAISDQEVEALSEMEHNRWNTESLILGYRPTTEEEHNAIQKDISLRTKYKAENKHDDLRNYHELGADESGLSVTRFDSGLIRTLPLLAYTYHQLNSKRHE